MKESEKKELKVEEEDLFIEMKSFKDNETMIKEMDMDLRL